MTRLGRRNLLFVGSAAVTGAAMVAPTVHASVSDDVVFGNRIPRDWFLFQGLGISEQGYGDDPYHTIAFDVALLKGGVADYNILSYSSVVPKAAYGNIIAPERATDGSITRPDSVEVVPGSVLEVIMANASITVPAGGVATVATGLGIRWASEPATPETLRNGYGANYRFTSDKAVPIDRAEDDARKALEESLEHEISIRALSAYRSDPDPQLTVFANQIDNRPGSRPKYVTQLTGIGCYRYIFPRTG